MLIKGEMAMSIVKEEAKKLIEKLPDQVTWDDIIYEFYVKKKIGAALKDVEKGRVIPHGEVKKSPKEDISNADINELVATTLKFEELFLWMKI